MAIVVNKELAFIELAKEHLDLTDEKIEFAKELILDYKLPMSGIFFKDDVAYCEVYGMSSETAMNKYYGGVDSHRTSEGGINSIPMKGPLKNTIQDILGGIRSGCSYVGAKKLKELSKRTTFIRTNEVRNTYWEMKVA